MDVETYDAVTGAPERRIANAANARSIWDNMLIADSTSAKNRANIDDMFDGAPPWDPDVLKNLGQGDRCNLNFGTAHAVLESAFSGYLDLTSSVDVMARCKVKAGTPDQQREWAGVIAEEFHQFMLRWPSFDRNTQVLSKEFIKHGVGVAFFPNDKDWRWSPTGLADAKFPRKAPIDECGIELVMVRKKYLPQELYNFIKDEATAKEAGWAPEFVKNALVNSCNSTTPNRYADWEALQKEIKNNDLASSVEVSVSEIPLVHAFVKEFDGRVSFYIFTEESLETGVGAAGSGKDGFLFVKQGFYPSMEKAITVFTYGPGNGFIHSLRGLGWRIYPQIQMENRLRCQIVDSTMLSSSLLLQISDPKDLDDFGFSFFGPYAVMNGGAKVVERAMPNLSQNAMPIVDDLMRQMENNTGTYHLRNSQPSGQERTKFEVQATLAQQAQLSQAAMNLFYRPWEKLLAEVMRRALASDLTSADPGGKEAFEFRRRCIERGVPAAALETVYDVEAVRAVGYGSPSVRLGALSEIQQMVPMLDEVGRNNAIRDRIAAVVGYQNVDRYLPKITVAQRVPVDAKIAELENGHLMMGQPVTALPGENHAVHTQVHLGEVSNKLAEIQQGADPRPFIQGLNMLLQHTEPHIQQMSQDPTRDQESGTARKMFQQMSAIVGQITQHEQARMRREAEAMAQAAVPSQLPQGMEGVPAAEQMQADKAQAELAAKLEREKIDMQIKAERAAQEMRIKEEAHRQQMAMDDARMAMKIRSDRGLAPQAGPPAA